SAGGRERSDEQMLVLRIARVRIQKLEFVEHHRVGESAARENPLVLPQCERIEATAIPELELLGPHEAAIGGRDPLDERVGASLRVERFDGGAEDGTDAVALEAA